MLDKWSLLCIIYINETQSDDKSLEDKGIIIILNYRVKFVAFDIT